MYIILKYGTSNVKKMTEVENAELGLVMKQITLTDKVEQLIKANWASDALKSDIQILVKEIAFFKNRLDKINKQ